MLAIIFESNQQVEFEAMSTKVNEHLKIVIPRYSAADYYPWSEAPVNTVTDQRALKIKEDIQPQIEGALTPAEIAAIVDIPRTDQDWFPAPPEE